MHKKSECCSTLRSRSTLYLRSYSTNNKDHSIEQSNLELHDSQREYFQLRQKQLEDLVQRKGAKALYPPLELAALTMKQFIDKYSSIQHGHVLETETIVLRGTELPYEYSTV